MLRKRWFRWAVILAAVLLIVSEGFSLLLRTAASRRYLTARLESSFGRPVEVRAFSFSLLDGPRIEASDVSVAEDPRFGREYFLRAEELTAGPRWSALLSGDFEFGTLSFTRPTLNLVRLSDGHWNLESWLPAPAAAGNRTAGGAVRAALRFHLSRIEVDTGRINFKQDQDVRAIALDDVTGALEQDSSGAWQLDFQARPMRPGVPLPQSGMVRISGVVGGTSSRLQPADLDVSLWGASVEDALRLARGQDYGIRGALSADLHASIQPPAPGDAAAANSSAVVPAEWNLSGVVRLAGIHRWDFPRKAGQPAVNVIVNALWRSGDSRISLTSLALEAPGSVVHASGEIAWNRGVHPHIVLAPSDVAYSDVLAWYRALDSGVDDDLAINGWVRAEGAFDDWPPRIVDASLESAGAQIVPPATLPVLRFGRWNTSLSPGALNSSLTVVQFDSAPVSSAAARPGQLRIQASVLSQQIQTGSVAPANFAAARTTPGPAWGYRISADGTADRVQDYVALAREFGGSITRVWTAQGGLAVDVRGAGNFHRGATDWQGTIESRGLSLQFAFLNEPVILPAVTLELGAGAAQKLTLTATQAFDAMWSGTISRSAARPAWQFDLTANRLDAAALDRWIEPRARPVGLLERLGLFGSAHTATGADVAAAVPYIPISARGRLRVAELSLAPLRVEQLDADIEVAGKSIDVHRATGSFAGGTVEGDFTAALGGQPAYDARVRFDRVDFATLAQDVPSLQNKFDGVVSADIALHATGIGRDALLASLEGEGSIAARNLQIRGFDLGMIRADRSAVDDERFADVHAVFRVVDRAVRATQVQLARPGGNLVANGSVDFQGALDFHIDASGAQSAPIRVAGPASFPTSAPDATLPTSYRLGGTLAAPILASSNAPVSAPPIPQPARNAIRGPQH